MDLAAIRTLESETGKTRPNEPWALFPPCPETSTVGDTKGLQKPLEVNNFVTSRTCSGLVTSLQPLLLASVHPVVSSHRSRLH